MTWREYGFRFKPGDLHRAPPWIAPYQPRLDWQMWFAALSSADYNPWFRPLLARLLQGDPTVLSLLDSNPFPTTPPRYVRAQLYEYHFTTAMSAQGAWWRRQLLSTYYPQVSLADLVAPGP